MARKITEDLIEKLSKLPQKSGVYIFKDNLGRVIYVGKAVNLRNRVRSYFQSPDKDDNPKLRWLRNSIADLDYTVVNSPVEALILESAQIKRYRPYFNVQRKDDKRYPFLEITIHEEFPRIRIVRHADNRKSRYFGPFTSSLSMRRTFKLVQKAFMLRTCKYDLKKPLPRPCLDYHLNLCPAPCVGYISQEDYGKLVERTRRFLEGRTGELLKYLRDQLEEYSASLQFEKCVTLRDLIQSVEHVTSRQQAMTRPGEDMDFIGLARAEGLAGISMLEVRDGRLLNQQKHLMELPLNQDDGSLLNQYVAQQYREGFFIPPAIFVPVEIEERSQLEEWLSGLRGRKVEIRIPERGEKKELLNIAISNAKEFINLKVNLIAANRERHKEELETLRDILGLQDIPRRIEGYDISNISGKMAVASMVVFREGEPLSEHYRRFRIGSKDEPDDFAMMHEALTRRFKNLKLAELESFREKPDLILIDGGKGQLSSVMEAAREQDIDGIPIISLAKREEEIFLPGKSDPLPVDKKSPGLNLLRRVRDESHRFALAYHRKLREKKMEITILDGIPGVAKKRKETLLRHFETIEDIKKASLYDLEQLPGFNRRVAEKILKYLGSEM